MDALGFCKPLVLILSLFPCKMQKFGKWTFEGRLE